MVTSDPRSSARGEQALVVGDALSHAGEPSPKRVGSVGRHQASDHVAVLGDLDLVALRDLVEQREDLSLDLE